MNDVVCVILYVLVYVGYIPRNGITELRVKCICNCDRYCQIALYLGGIILYSLHQCKRALLGECLYPHNLTSMVLCLTCGLLQI